MEDKWNAIMKLHLLFGKQLRQQPTAATRISNPPDHLVNTTKKQIFTTRYRAKTIQNRRGLGGKGWDEPDEGEKNKKK